jgi:hypothetical protein
MLLTRVGAGSYVGPSIQRWANQALKEMTYVLLSRYH